MRLAREAVYGSLPETSPTLVGHTSSCPQLSILWFNYADNMKLRVKQLNNHNQVQSLRKDVLVSVKAHH